MQNSETCKIIVLEPDKHECEKIKQCLEKSYKFLEVKTVSTDKGFLKLLKKEVYNLLLINPAFSDIKQ